VVEREERSVGGVLRLGLDVNCWRKTAGVKTREREVKVEGRADVVEGMA